MTEAEWLASEDPEPMLESLERRASERKLRLFATACCRRVIHVIEDERIRGILEVSERYADGQTDASDVDCECWIAECAHEYEIRYRDEPEMSAVCALRGLRSELDPLWAWHDSSHAAAHLSRKQQNKPPPSCSIDEFIASEGKLPIDHERLEELAVQAQLLRCIFGNPFRPVSLDPSWLTSTVVALVEGIYADRAFDRLPILADALEDAGCDHADILAHCRGNGPHARGCWVVDLLLGKE